MAIAPTQPTLSAYTRDFGQTVTIYTQNSLSGCQHYLSYSFAGQTGNLNNGQSVSNSYTWTIPDMSSRIPNANNGICTITCVTYFDLTLIGTKTVTLTLNVPASALPQVSVSLQEGTTSPSGIASTFGAYVQSKSRVKVTITASSSTSTIAGYSTTVDGNTYTSSTFTSNVLKTSGTLPVKTTVTDSRGRTTTVTNNITVLAYTPPQISSFSAWRADSSGNKDSSGTYVRASFAASINSVSNHNTKQWKVQYKVTNSGGYANAADPITPSSYTFSSTNFNTKSGGGYSALTS